MDLKIDSVTLTLNGNTFVSLENAPLSGALIQPDTEVNFNALFEPVEVFQPTGMPIATIEVKSNDADSNPALVHIFGKVGYPDLKVTPPETVDFGFVAKNMIVTRDVNLYNSGGAPLKIYGIYLEGALTNEFAIEKDENFPPLSSAPGEGEIAGGEFYVMKVAFTNLQGESGTEKAQLKILSNDLDNPEIVLDLIAKRTDSPECKVAFQPEKMNFGTVSYGYSKIMTVNLVNAGGGNCTIKQAHIDDCISLMGISQCAVNGKPGSIKSNPCQILNMPLPTPEGFKPGDSYPVQIRFIPPDNVKLMLPGEFMSFSSLFTVTMEDPYSKQTFNYPYVGIPNDPNNPPVSPNILAKAGQSYIIGIPNELDFGLITIGCSSQTMTVKVYNIGEKPENVSSVELVGCTPEFKIVGYPALPALVTLGNSVNVEVKYTPQDKGNDGCSLLIKTTDPGTPELTVPLKGAGTFDSEQTDTFKQVSGQEVDVLFAVDCSGSMGDDQKNLADNFDYFISKASKWNNDYHIGVVSCDFDEENGMRGKLMGSPRFVTPQNWQDFKKNVKLGDMCSATEQGLISSQAALSFPLAHDTDIACQNNSPCTEPDKCVDGFCGGYNRGFLRKDARLEVIVVSDEEDQSPVALS
ncbi:MAG: choice-of-anchor D domain-containing protein, partial [Deltaproteobacteria bacterium]|nr:choice-of-anchor D domain-containing protein [Deltaproteobacteria bacterium]